MPGSHGTVIAAEIESERGLERQANRDNEGARHAVRLVGGCSVARIVLGCYRCTSEQFVQYRTPRAGVTMSRPLMMGRAVTPARNLMSAALGSRGLFAACCCATCRPTGAENQPTGLRSGAEKSLIQEMR